MKDTLTGWNTIDPTKKKRCTKCGVVKYLTEFKKDRRRCVDGTRNVCTLCYTKQDKRSKMLREQWLSAGKVIPNVCEVCGKKSNPNEILGKRKDLTPIKIQEIAKKFKDAGATILGGCCETNPSHIKAIAKIK